MEIKKEYIPVIVLILFLLVVGLWMLQYRWINPDEGAHLADGKLLLEGKVPLVDFKSRQPFYVALLAIFLKIFGMNYQSGRLLMLLSTVGISAMIYFIAKKLYNKDTALIAQLIYVVFPFTILYSSIVKTHNIMIFWGSVGVLFYLLFSEKEKKIYLLLSGISLGLAFYVRESSLAWVITIVLAIAISNWKNLGKTSYQICILATGFFVIIFAVLAIYLNYMSLHDFWNSPLNPFYQILRSFNKIGVFLNILRPKEASQIQVRAAGQDFSISLRELKQIIRMNIYLFVALGLYLIYLLKDIFAKNKKLNFKSIKYNFLPIWLLTTFSVYGYYFFVRGFFPAYSLEFFPPMILCLAYLIIFRFSGSFKSAIRFTLLGAGAAYLIFFIQKYLFGKPDLSIIFMITFVVILIYLLSREKIFRKNKREFILFSLVLLFIVLISQSHIVTRFISGRIAGSAAILILIVSIVILVQNKLVVKDRMMTRFVIIPLMWASLMAGFGEASWFLSIRYDNIWSPKIAEKVKSYFDENGQNGDTILSGAMVWGIHPKLEPYLNITHPSSFLSELAPGFDGELKKNLEQRPPDFIVEDIYTLRNYKFLGEFFNKIIQDRYVKVKQIGEGRTTVSIYRLLTDQKETP